MTYHLQKYYQLHYFGYFKLSIQNLQHKANYRLLHNELLLLYIVFMQTACTCHHKLKTYRDSKNWKNFLKQHLLSWSTIKVTKESYAKTS
jgi:hypothetical protein